MRAKVLCRDPSIVIKVPWRPTILYTSSSVTFR
jgi:hypothetical protein